MPRTPMLRELRRLASIVREAHARGVPPSVVRAERGMTRREFVRLASIAAGSVALAGCVGRTPRPADAGSGGLARVAVVGGGLAGLTAAHRLAEAGVDVTLYEGAPRLGGRCHTRRGDFADDQVAERGGELIDTGHEEIQVLAAEFGLELDDLHAAGPEGALPVYVLDGKPYTYEEATADFLEAFPTIAADAEAAGWPITADEHTDRAAELDRVSIFDYVEANVPGGTASRFGRLLLVAYEIEYGADPRDQSALSMLALLGYSAEDEFQVFGESDERFHVRGGNDLLVAALAESVGDRARTRWKLRSLAREGEGWRLGFETKDGLEVVEVDRVVLALPFAVLRRDVDLAGAGFSEEKSRAIRDLGMGRAGKLHLQFAGRPWHAAGLTGETFGDLHQTTWEESRAQAGSSGLLVQFLAADASEALADGTPSTHAERLFDALGPVLPGVADAWNGKALVDLWNENPWSRGAYSYYRVGQFTTIGGHEGRAEGTCHFAGEHTSTDYQGYLNGAVESGERAAAEVLAALGLADTADE